eukprot:m.1333273 g.1333273  ORF g.1333273 m.1333273 type:complete len:524 (-) comp24870_c0_seq6:3108-4679(-)
MVAVMLSTGAQSAEPSAQILMQGELLKWTNFYYGWQERYFTVADGMLSYFSCEEDATKSCRGSINLRSAELTISRDDPLRFEVTGLNSTIYLKAHSPDQRQQWILALANAKTQSRNTLVGLPTSASVESISNSSSKVTEDVSTSASGGKPLVPIIQEISSSRDSLALQTSSLVALSQQHGESSRNPEIQRVARAINAECDRLLEALRSLSMTTEDASTSIVVVHGSSCGAPSANKSSPPRSGVVLKPPMITPVPVPSGQRYAPLEAQHQGRGTANPNPMQPLPSAVQGKNVHPVVEASSGDVGGGDVVVPAVRAPPPRSAGEQSFFSLAVATFDASLDARACTVNTAAFLAAADAILPFIDRLGSALTIVKSDINGNIRKIEAAYTKAPAAGHTLQDLIGAEVAAGTATAAGSASDALLWLRRALDFICEFLTEFFNGKETAAAAGVAYTRTLAQYHGWFVRGAFSMAMKSVPYRVTLLKALGPAPEAVVVADAAPYIEALRATLAMVQKLLTQHDLDSSTKV